MQTESYSPFFPPSWVKKWYFLVILYIAPLQIKTYYKEKLKAWGKDDIQ